MVIYITWFAYLFAVSFASSVCDMKWVYNAWSLVMNQCGLDCLLFKNVLQQGCGNQHSLVPANYD